MVTDDRVLGGAQTRTCPAYANAEGKPVLFCQERARFKARYGNLTFFGPAQLEDGTIWPTSYALTEPSSADECFRT